MAEHEVIARVVFTGTDAATQAADLKAQIDARMTNSTVGGIGTPSERTSYVRHENDGVLAAMTHVDEFGIVRQGEYIAPNPYPLWIQPTGAHDSYPVLRLDGQPTRVMYNGTALENTSGTVNSWAPPTGWTEVAL
jgi:hypothetical protein